MKQIKLNTTTKIGDKTFKCIEGNDCRECDFAVSLCYKYACSPKERKDKKFVIFKREEKQ